MLTILAYFNPFRWKEFISYLDEIARKSVSKIINGMVEEFENKVNNHFSNQNILQEGKKIKGVFLKLEQKEHELEES